MPMMNMAKSLNYSHVIVELTLLNGTSGNLDELLCRFGRTLGNYPSLGFSSSCAIALFSQDRELLPIGACGLEAIGDVTGIWRFLQTDGAMTPHRIDRGAAQSPAYALPIQEGGRHLGYAVLFGYPGASGYEADSEFLGILAVALSGLVGRFMLDEIVKIREWELEEARSDAIHRLGAAAEYRDHDTGLHVLRMTNYAIAVAKEMGLPVSERELLYVAAPMHDVGKIGIPDVILLKPGRLSAEEIEVMRQHADIGGSILVGQDDLTTAAREIAVCHHERWDGKGYPQGLQGEEIPVLARICSVADVFDALSSPRPYKEAWPVEKAADWIFDQSGSQFDPSVAEAFRRALPEILRIRALYRDEIIDPKQVLNLAPAKLRDKYWVSWEDGLNVGIDVIDEHHRHLFDIVNDCHDVVAERRGAQEVARLIKRLEQYTHVHFQAEERMMERLGYAGLERQIRQHQRFCSKLHGFRAALHLNPLTAPYDLLKFVGAWLSAHIREEDIQLKALAA
ncbi:MAG TPA: bacteriohemerythrin [Rhodospirillaceae bacterium]|nr:bacteriohemerythrin [Rhodospirillaceae bacterium]